MDTSYNLMNTPDQGASDFMNAPSPQAMSSDSVSSRDYSFHHEPQLTDEARPSSAVAPLEGSWRVAHTLRNQDNVRLESPTSPVLTFW